MKQKYNYLMLRAKAHFVGPTWRLVTACPGLETALGTRETVTKERDRDPRETERQAQQRLEAQSAKTIKRDNSI